MPLPLICHPDADWWIQYYDPGYHVGLNHHIRGLSRDCFEYKIWTRKSGDNLQVDYKDKAESLKLHGLPGTIFVLYDVEDWGAEYPRGFKPRDREFAIIRDGQRTLERPSIRLSNAVDFVSWGFGPLADAGDDQWVVCGDTVTLDARRAIEFLPEDRILQHVYGLPGGRSWVLARDWEFRWYDESDGDMCIGMGPLRTTPLSPGKHIIRLEVSGTRVKEPRSHETQVVTVRDWCEVDVDLAAPRNVVAVSLCDAVEIFWDPVSSAFGYMLYRDDELLQDVGPNTSYVDHATGKHRYQVYSYDKWMSLCALPAIDVVIRRCPDNPDSTLSALTDGLEQNRPNPFRESTVLTYSLARPGHVILSIYNAGGQKVKTLVDRSDDLGSHSVVWDGTDDYGNRVSSGIYFCRMDSGGHVSTRKLSRLR